MNVRYNRPGANLKELIRLNLQAAEAGAKIIVNTEMAISGYSFSSREEISGAVQTANGYAAQALAEIAAKHGAYIVVGYAERDPATDIYYNAATAFSPEGKIFCHYRKNSAETRWACPGNPLQNNTFKTPWGRAGLRKRRLFSRVQPLRGRQEHESR